MARDAVAVLDAAGVGALSSSGLARRVRRAGGRDPPAGTGRVAHADVHLTPPDGSHSSGAWVGQLAIRAIRGLPVLRYRIRGGERNLVKERVAKIMSVNGANGIDVAEIAELVIYDLRERQGVNVKALLQHHAAVSATRSRTSALRELHVPTW